MQSKYNNKSTYKSTYIMAFIFLLVAVVGFAYVKWLPYYAKAFLAQANHSIGDSVIYGNASSAPVVSLGAAIDYAIAYSKAIWKAMILGLLLGSGIKVLLPAHWVSNLLGRMGFKSVIRGSLLAIPCMMCTCCAAPVAASMRQSRASIGSVVAWWLSNPLLNPAALVFMGFVLGWGWAIFRTVFGLAMVLGIAYLAERYAKPSELEIPSQPILSEQAAPTGHFLKRWLQEFTTMTFRLIPEYIILVLLLGAAKAWLFPVFGADESNIWILAMAVAGMLFVIPTAGEVPIVQAMFALGMGAGPAAALMMTLPAVSLLSLMMLGKVFSLKIRVVIALSVVIFGVLAGFTANLIF
jgi:uncharacterized protein